MKPFPWRPGMRAIEHDNTAAGIVVAVHERRLDVYNMGRLEAGDDAWFAEDCEPDQEDPATLGALLGAAEEAWAPIGVLTVVAPVAATLGEPWRVRLTDRVGAIRAVFAGRTRFDALMAAWWSSP